jgi:hypothetical protein
MIISTCVCDVSKPTRDPTGTYDVRRRFKIATDLRWRKFAKLLRQTIVGQDILGLGPEVSNALSISFANLPADARLRSLQTWTDDMLRRVVLENDTAYLDPMSSIGYNRAIARAQKLTGTKAVPEGAADAISLLQHLTMTELQGIVETVSQQIVRAGSNAILEHNTQADTMRAMTDVIEKIGVVRTRAMVELIIVKAHATGTLDTLVAAGVKRVGLLPELRAGKKLTGDAAKPVAPAPGRRGTSPSTIGRIAKSEQAVEQALSSTEQVEVLTAGDDLVCPECEEIAADGPYYIDEARSLIPAHPNCRCSFVPEGSELFGVFTFSDEEERGPDGRWESGGGISAAEANLRAEKKLSNPVEFASAKSPEHLLTQMHTAMEKNPSPEGWRMSQTHLPKGGTLYASANTTAQGRTTSMRKHSRIEYNLREPEQQYSKRIGREKLVARLHSEFKK